MSAHENDLAEPLPPWGARYWTDPRGAVNMGTSFGGSCMRASVI
jgi:hypothetical protein